jgi:hypothetical protein
MPESSRNFKDIAIKVAVVKLDDTGISLKEHPLAVQKNQYTKRNHSKHRNNNISYSKPRSLAQSFNKTHNFDREDMSTMS